MRKSYLAVILIGVISCSATKPEDMSPHPIPRLMIYDAVVMLHAVTATGDPGIGTGFFVSDDAIVTAAHVTHMLASSQVFRARMILQRGGVITQARDLVILDYLDHPSADISLLRVEIRDYHQIYTLCADDPTPGERSVAIGFPGGRYEHSDVGIVLSDFPPNSMFYDFAARGGYSGGPILRLDGGCVGGVVWGGISIGGKHYAFGVSASMVHEILSEFNAPPSP